MNKVEKSYSHIEVVRSEDPGFSLTSEQMEKLALEGGIQLKEETINVVDFGEMSASFQISPCGSNPIDADRYKGFDLICVYVFNELCT